MVMSSSISPQSSAHKHSSGYPHVMGSSFSSGRERHSIGSPEYGKHTFKMGNGASHTSDHFPRDSGYHSQGSSIPNLSKYGSSEEGHQRHQVRCGRPLPNGPGPLMPAGGPRRNRKKPEPIQAKGPVKANHLIHLNGNSHRTESRSVVSPNGGRSLSRIKSRSMSDVRDTGNNQAPRPIGDKVVMEADQRMLKKTFQVTRSPSIESISISRNRRKGDEQAILDRLGKLRTDDSLRSIDNNKDFHSKKQGYSVPPLKADYVNNVPNKSRLPHYQPGSSSESSASKHNGVLRGDRPDKATFSSRQRPVARQSSDSAYESNSSTGSSSGHSSPGMSKDIHYDASSRKGSSRGYGSGLVGLRNLGNTCFMNSILQCLRCSKKLREVLCKDEFIEKMIETIRHSKGGLTKAFTNVVREMWSPSSSGAPVSPNVLKSQVQRYAPQFVGYSQQDSQEFLRFLLEGLHDDLNLSTEKSKRNYPDISKLSDSEQAMISWESYRKREKSLISDFFVGQLKSTLTCTECGFRSLTFDPFWDLSLPIPTRSQSSLLSAKVSLYDCFKRFTQEETLDGDEKPTCERCKKRRKCLKQFSIDRFPHILVIHLKRFSGMRYRTKLETLVEFPFDLNLSNFAACAPHNKSEAQYRLFGVSNHSGGTYSGHYTAYCLHPDQNEWYYFSDSLVSKFSRSRVVSEEAYVLFYELSNQLSYL